MLKPGTIVKDRYEVLRLLGKGGLSYVYEVEDRLLPKRWAMKEFHPRHLGEEELAQVRAQFKTEVAILSGLSHPRLPAVSDSFPHEGNDYMVMELVEGKTLDELLRERSAPFPEATVRQWALQILEILEYLHGRTPPIIYRDIKPQNIIIVDGYGVRFIDFGIARLFNPVKDQDTIFMGTPGFAPPEQFRQHQTDFRSDIYSLGATMHLLLTLKDPGMNPFDFEPASIISPDVSPLMERIVQKAVEIKPENRFQRASDIRRALLGEVTMDDLFRQSFVIIEPREIEFSDCAPAGRHAREVTIRNTSGEPLHGHIAPEHPGVRVKPADFAAPQVTVEVSLENRAFPRGEKVTTALVLSTEKAKISIPVTVQLKPTFMKGLSPALASLLLFAVSGAAGFGWVRLLASLPAVQPPQEAIILVGCALLLGISLPLKYMGKLSAFLFMGIAALTIPAAELARRAVTAGNALNPEYGTAFLLFLLVAILTGHVIFRTASALTARQRLEMKLVVPASFFVFPVLLYLYPHLTVGQLSGSFVLRNTTLFFCLSSLVSLFYALAWSFLANAEPVYAGSARPVKLPLLRRLSWTLVLAAGFGAIWYYLDVQYRLVDPSGAFLAARPLLDALCRFTVLLPLTCEPLLHGGALACVIAAAALAALFFALLPKARAAAYPLVTLVVLASLLNVAMSLDGAYRDSLAAYRAMLHASPEKMLTEFAIPRRDVFSARFFNFYRSLLLAYKSVSLRQYEQARRRLDLAIVVLDEAQRASVEGKKLRFLADQVKIWNFLAYPETVTFDYLGGELAALERGGVDAERFSSRELRYFAGSGPAAPGSDIFLLPNRWFFLLTAKGPVEFTNDREVLLSVLYYKAYLLECRGRFREASAVFGRLERILGAAVRTPVAEVLMTEAAQRSRLAPFAGDRKRYLRELVAFYRLGDSGSLAVPLLVFGMERIGGTLFEKAELVETLFSMGAAERAENILDRLKAVTEGEGDILYLDGIRMKCKGLLNPASLALGAAAKVSPGLLRNVTFLRKQRDIAADLRRWDEAARLTARVGAIDRAQLNADDHLKWGVSLDMAGRYGKAIPHYERYVAAMTMTDHHSPRLALVTNRLAGGPMPMYLVMEQIAGARFRLVICGEGIPPELLPELVYYHQKDEKPDIVLSENVRLEEKRTWTNKNYKKTYSKVIFIDPRGERMKRTWRFSCFLNFSHPSFYPMEFVHPEKSVFNAMYVRSVAPDYILDEQYSNAGIFMAGNGRHFFAAVPRFRFEPPYRNLELIDGLHNLPDEFEYFAEEITPSELFDLFSVKQAGSRDGVNARE